jgi:PAS domain-containing protein
LTSIAEGLLANLGLIAIFVSAWVYSLQWSLRLSERANLIVVVVLTGGSVIALMAIPFEIQPGVHFDLRLAPVALSGFLGGPLVGIATAGVAILYRLWLGGAGVPAAMFSIVVTMAIAIAGHRMLHGRSPQLGAVIVLALATAAVSLVSTLLLPLAFWVFVLPRVAVPSAVIIFAAIAATGATIVIELRRREVEAENRLYRALIDSLPEQMNAKDAEGRFLLANPATAELMQAGSAAALIGNTDFYFYPRHIAE